MTRILLGAAAMSLCLALSACATGAGGGVAELSPVCAQQYQQASEQSRGVGEQQRAVYTHYVSPNCREEQERLDKAQR